MQLLPIAALILGFVSFWQIGSLPTEEVFARYTAIAILAGLDTILGGIRAWLTGDYDDAVFVTGFIFNALLAVGLVYLGERLGLETGFGDGRISVMMIGAVVVFSGRILNNLAALRRLVIDRLREPKETQSAAKTVTA